MSMPIITPPAPTPAFEQQLAVTPDATTRLNIASDYFNIYRGDFKAMKMTGGITGVPYQDASNPINGIRRYMASNYEPTIMDTIKNYDKQYALGWKFTSEDLLAIEIKLLSRPQILATISYGYSQKNGPGPWSFSPLLEDIKNQITSGSLSKALYA